MKTRLDRFTLSIFAALGLPLGCSPGSIGSSGTDTETGDGDGDPTTTGDGDGDGDPTTTGDGDGDGDPTTTGDGDGDGDGDPYACANPQPILQADTDIPSGFVSCEDGFVHRVEAVECVNPTVIDDPSCAEFGGGACSTGADCQAQPFGGCAVSEFEGCTCSYGCATDADCDPGSICACAGVVGDAPTCIPAGCAADAACGDGLCGLSTEQGCCGDSYSLGCASPEADCHVSAECEVDLCQPLVPEGDSAMYQCSIVADAWVCNPPGWCGCDCGRPFLVDGEARVAAPSSRTDWARIDVVRIRDLDPTTRRALADAWTEIGLFEHASVASFARFATQLLSLAAPPHLLAATHSAMRDEIRHAELAFGLASAYAGEPIGPGQLALAAATPSSEPTAIVEALIVEACVGETLAAIEADEAAARAEDPVVAAVLRAIAADELRHAQLGWRALRWILDGGDESLRVFAIGTLRTALANVSSRPSRADLEHHGILAESTRVDLRRAALTQVLQPAVDALATANSVRAPRATASF